MLRFCSLSVALQSMRTHHVKNIVFSSSVAVYGNKAKNPLSEESLCFPENPYGETKFIGELVLKDYIQAGFVKAVYRRCHKQERYHTGPYRDEAA